MIIEYASFESSEASGLDIEISEFPCFIAIEPAVSSSDRIAAVGEALRERADVRICPAYSLQTTKAAITSSSLGESEKTRDLMALVKECVEFECAL